MVHPEQVVHLVQAEVLALQVLQEQLVQVVTQVHQVQVKPQELAEALVHQVVQEQ